ncbi:Ankyrin repeat domain-containing protein, partial [Lachnellula subtilissima]
MSLPETEILGPGFSLAELELRPFDVMARRIVSLSGGLIETKQHGSDHIVQFTHQSVNDFLLRDGLRFLDKKSGDPIGQGHHQLSLICANYMRFAEMDRPKTLDADIIKTRLPFVDYVVRSWFLHAEQAETRGVPQDYLLRYAQYYPSTPEHWVQFYRILNPYFYSGQRPEESSTMLHIASSAGLLSVVKGLLSTHYVLEQMDSDGNRALHYASRWGHTEVVKVLLDAGAVVEAEDNSKHTALERAAANGHEEIVRLLLFKGADVNKQTGRTGDALCGAAAKGSRAIVQLLLENKADVNAQGGDYSNALQAAICGGHQATVQLLLDNKADVNTQGGHYYGNALQAAALRGHQATVQLLLNNKAD